jgi:tetratricopeptide (TPR) repeat protein
MRKLLSLLLFAVALPIAAQPGADEQLAAQYFQQGDFAKAVLYYERLYKQQPTDYYYEQLLKSQLGVPELEAARKLVRDRMRRQGDDPKLLIDMGHVMELSGETDKAQKEYERAIKTMKGDQTSVRNVASAFQSRNKLDLALAAYEKGQRSGVDGTGYLFEIAQLHGLKGDSPKMIASYMDLLGANEAYLQAVQNSISRQIEFEQADARSEVLRTELLRRIQRDPSRAIYAEMLIWMLIQQKDLVAAFTQAKALDKRMDEGGARIMELARIAEANREYGTAFKCYDYVIGLGRNDANYFQARTGAVHARYLQLTDAAPDAPEPLLAELVDLDQRMAATITDMGLNKATMNLLRERAHLKAYFINQPAEAMALLEEGLSQPGIDGKMKAELKIDLGDIHVLSGDIWEASLLFSQVDLDFKHDALGHEARLRNAKVSFYSGDFLWAQAQLQVLKQSTSKLIANDAMELSLRITDALGIDSNAVPLSYFARAELLRAQRLYDPALLVLDSLVEEFPMHSLGDDVLFERFRIAYARKRYDESAGYLEKVLELWPNDILVDNALLELGRLYEEKLKDNEKAKQYFEKLLFTQTGSIFVPEARERYRRLRGDAPDSPEEKKPPVQHP